MKRVKFIFLFLIVFGSSLTVQSQTNHGRLQDIETYFQSIDRDTNLKSISLEDGEFMEHVTDGGGELTGVYKNDIIVKIIEWIGLSNGNSTTEYYFKNNKLVFVFEKFESFIENKNGDGFDNTKTKTTFEGKYYFNDSKVIDQNAVGKRNFGDNSQDIAKELLSGANEGMKALTKKR